ncbi:MAG: hypothetical protein JNIBNLAF_01802 [Nitrosomonas europaea]|nr:hypothetical protein [Nitrosomonas europaea]
MVGIVTEFIRYHLEQFAFHFQDIFTRCDTDTVGYAENMRIHCNGGFAKGSIQNHAGGFPTDSRQLFQFRAGARDLTVVLFDQ